MSMKTALALCMTAGCSDTHITAHKADPQAGDTGVTSDTGETADDSSVTTGACDPTQPYIEIGTGEADFEPLTDGDSIEVIHGAQDGHHILGSVRLYNTDDIATIHYWIEFPADDSIVSDQVYRMQMRPLESGEPCDFEAIGLFAYLGRIDPGSAPFLDQEVLLHMDVEDIGGRRMSKSVPVIPFLIEVERDPVR